MNPGVHRIGRFTLRRLTRVDLASLHFKFALVIMLWSPMWNNPTMQKQLTGQLLVAWIWITVVGFLCSVAGLLMGAQTDETRRRGFRWEMTGLWLLMAGPLVFLAVQFGLWITTGENKGLAIMFPYVVMAAIGMRMAMVKAAAKTILYRFPGEAEADD